MRNKIKKILVANRGEIAVRVIRAARELGIKTVSIYSDVDRLLPHVTLADETYSLGDSDPLSSYLNIKKIIQIAKSSNADAIHPGYGFLSENSEFALQIESEKLIFIGPSSENIYQMGNKIIARNFVEELGIPLIPATYLKSNDYSGLKKKASKIGYPLLIKASAGGGGKGMRIVENEKELEFNIERAKSEAKEAFGNDEIFIEKYIKSPHHIEIQVLADQHGNAIHLFERDCSIQRRHQKLVEESPSPFISEITRKKLTDAALKITRACNYRGAGTIEFILDENEMLYFLEMNTRLQVEHPVTEAITGVDIVREQISIAEGNHLNIKQKDITQNGHAIELRIYAEDPDNNFLPLNGVLSRYQAPKGSGVRVDDGYEEGISIPYQYDSLIGKLIVFSESRNRAINKLRQAITEYSIGKIPTTLKFGRKLLESQAFLKGKYNTHFVSELYKKYDSNKKHDKEAEIALIAAVITQNKLSAQIKSVKPNFIKASGWKRRKN